MPTLIQRSLSFLFVIGIAGSLMLSGPASLNVRAASVEPVHIQQTAASACPSGTIQFRLEEEELTDGTKTDGEIEILLSVYAAPDGDPLSAFDFTVLSDHIVLIVGTMDGIDGGYFYDYRPGGTQADSFLTSPGPAHGGTYKDISHIDFCYEPLTGGPTAAPASINGRVTQPNGRPIYGAVLMLQDHTTGEVRRATTNSFGYYKFDNAEVTHFYSLTVRSKKYRFTNPTTSFSLESDMFDMNFVGSR